MFTNYFAALGLRCTEHHCLLCAYGRKMCQDDGLDRTLFWRLKLVATSYNTTKVHLMAFCCDGSHMEVVV
jgi:hypothetical protein